MSERANLAKWIEDAVGDEPIDAVVIGPEQGHDYRDPTELRQGQKLGVRLAWPEAKPMLDYEFYSGYGSADCNPITLWTRTRVFFIAEYDGSTRLVSVPRNPVDHTPEFA